MRPSIRLSGVSLALQGKTWESDRLLRIGRLDSLEVVLIDSSISRQHAEVSTTEQGWEVRDLGSTNGTFLNAAPVGRTPRGLDHDDILRCGESILAVALVQPGVKAPAEAPPGAANKQLLFLHMVAALSRATGIRDSRASGRAQRVTDYATMLAKELDLPAIECEQLLIGTPLHDLGMLGMESRRLQRSSRTSTAEREKLKAQMLKSAAILATIAELRPLMPIIRSYRERWDGDGLPDGLAGEKIPRLARIVAVADAFEALTGSWSGRQDLTLDEAFDELLMRAGSEFDPNCVYAFLRLRSKLGERIHHGEATDVTVLKEMAYQDGLTGLPNRRQCAGLFHQAIAHARRKGQMAAVLFVDLDCFKSINDSLGHGAGDLLLQLVAKRLKGCVRESDTVARLGGDEFLIILDGVPHAEGALVVAQKILYHLSLPCTIETHDLVITASIGIALYPTDGDTVDMLVDQADLAMYDAKAQGKNGYRLYHSSMKAIHRSRLESRGTL